jgi:hypothetical protein
MGKRTTGRSDRPHRVGVALTRDAERDAFRGPAEHRPGSLEDEIRLRAYYRYVQRDGEPGDAISDWLEAESDVLGRRATGVDAAERVGDDEAVPTTNAPVPPAGR